MSQSPSIKTVALSAAAVVAAGVAGYMFYRKKQEDLKKEIEFGFSRPEMLSVDIRGKLDGYQKHFLVGTGAGSPSKWPSKIESDNGIGQMWSNVRKQIETPVKDRITAFDGPKGCVLVYPDRVAYQVPEFTVPIVSAILQQHLLGQPTAEYTAHLPAASKITADYIFVCAHAARDGRCGACGPVLITEFTKAVSARQKSLAKAPASTEGHSDIRVHACSHIGGHAYAGNMMAFFDRAPTADEHAYLQANCKPYRSVVCGDWYGYVIPADVPRLLRSFIDGSVILEKWRGALGLDSATMELVVKSRQKEGSAGPDDSRCVNCSCSKQDQSTAK